MSAPPEYFLDTAFAIALASKSDVFHLERHRDSQESEDNALTTDDHFRQAGFRVLLA